MFDLAFILFSSPKFVGELRVNWSAYYRLTNSHLRLSVMFPSLSQFPIFLSSCLTIICGGMFVVTTGALDCFNYGRSEGWKQGCAARILTTAFLVLLSVAGFLLTHSSEWKINQVLHPVRCYCFVTSNGAELPSRALIFICFQFLDTGFIEPFSTGSKLEGEQTVGRKQECA